MTFMNQKRWLATMMMLLCFTGLLHAQDKEVEQKQVDQKESIQKEADQKEIDQWIEQLDSDSLTKRQQARTQLVEAGAKAIPDLAKAANSDKRGLIVHSIDILAEIRNKSEDEKTKQTAADTLKLLSESKSPSTAQRAKLALEAKKDSGIQAFPGWDKPDSEFAGQSMNRSVSVSSFNGIKTITVKEGGKTTILQDQRAGSIRVRVEGVGEPKEFVAKNLDELKKKDPDAFALYQQHGANSGGVNVGNFPGFGGMGAFGGNGGQANAGGNVMNMPGTNNANQMMIQQLERIKKRMAGNQQMQQMLDQQIRNLKK